MRSFLPDQLYYITHIDNLESILEKGILSHEKIEQLGLNYTSIYNEEVVNIRKDKSTPGGKNLWHYANLYFQPRNSMMYSVLSAKEKECFVVVSVSNKVLGEHGVFITDGNAANNSTQFHRLSDGLAILKKQWKIVQSEWWNEGVGSKRKIMAECLAPIQVKPEFIRTLYVVSVATKKSVEQIIDKRQIDVVPEPHMFFEPKIKTKVGDNISLIDGDMFFSNMRTLTISVNLKGVMGKGLASRESINFLMSM